MKKPTAMIALSLVVAVLGACAADEIDETEQHHTDWGNGICDSAGQSVDCGQAGLCAWDCSAGGECVTSCADAREEWLSASVGEGETAWQIEAAPADCHLGDVDDGTQLLSVEYESDDGSRLTLYLFAYEGPGDYNVGGGEIGRVAASYVDSSGTKLGSGVCSVSLALREDGGVETTGQHFQCQIWEGSLSDTTQTAKVQAEFSCSPAALWY